MGQSKRYKCVKCGARDCCVEFHKKWKPEYPGQEMRYDRFDNKERTLSGEHLEITCRECHHRWTTDTADAPKTPTPRAGKAGKKPTPKPARSRRKA